MCASRGGEGLVCNFVHIQFGVCVWKSAMNDELTDAGVFSIEILFILNVWFG